MIDESIFSELSKINGYLGAVLSDYTGEVLVSDTAKLKKLNETSVYFNESFRTLHDVTKKLGLGHAHVMDVDADKAEILMMCSGVENRVHLHAFVIMEKGSSTALAKIELKNILDKAVEDLAS